jgi:hypothetical protein
MVSARERWRGLSRRWFLSASFSSAALQTPACRLSLSSPRRVEIPRRTARVSATLETEIKYFEDSRRHAYEVLRLIPRYSHFESKKVRLMSSLLNPTLN